MHQSIAYSAAVLMLCPVTFWLSGCGGSNESATPAASATADKEGNSPGDGTPQAAIVQKFLQALQRGDRDSARNLLTARAVQAFDQHNLLFLPEAITSGAFQIGQTVQSGNTFFVQCIWTDQDTGGQPQSERIQWMVKAESGEKWRIYGLAVHVQEDGENLVINFEQPEELLRHQRENQATEPSSTSPSAPPQQAALPQDPFQSAPR